MAASVVNSLVRRDVWQFSPSADPTLSKKYFIAVDWLFDVIENQQFPPELLFHAANLFGRYVNGASVPSKNIQVIFCAAMIVAEDYVIIWNDKDRYDFYVFVSSGAFNKAQLEYFVDDLRRKIQEFSLTPYDFLIEDLKLSKITDDIYDRAFTIIVQNVSKYSLNTQCSARTIATSAEILAEGKESGTHSPEITLCLELMINQDNRIKKITDTYFTRKDLGIYLQDKNRSALGVLYMLLSKYMTKVDNSYLEIGDCYTKRWFVDAKLHPITREMLDSEQKISDEEKYTLVKQHYRQKLITDFRILSGEPIYSLSEYVRNYGYDEKLETSIEGLLEPGGTIDPKHMSTDPDDLIFTVKDNYFTIYIVRYPYLTNDMNSPMMNRYLEIYFGRPFNPSFERERLAGEKLYFRWVLLPNSLSRIIPLPQDLINYILTHSRDELQVIYRDLLDLAYLDIQIFNRKAYLGGYTIDPITRRFYIRFPQEDIEYSPQRYPDFDISAISKDQILSRLKDYIFEQFLTKANQVLDVDNKITSYAPNLFVKVKPSYNDGMCDVGWTINNNIKGEGGYGITYEACCGDKCGDYVMKFVRFIEKSDRDDFKRESDVGIEMSRLGVGPKIVSISSDDNFGMIVMETMDITVGDILDYLESLKEDEKVDPSYTKPIEDAVKYTFHKIIDHIRTIHNLGYYHGDLHMSNVMVKFVNLSQNPEIVSALKEYRYPLPGDYAQTFTSIQVRLIDFGFSKLCPADVSECGQQKIEDYFVLYDNCAEMGFDDLANYIQRDIMNLQHEAQSLQSV